jgi:hypothetical protein
MRQVRAKTLSHEDHGETKCSVETFAFFSVISVSPCFKMSQWFNASDR